jgi:two-component system response regulator
MSKLFRILIVDDDDDDQFLIKNAFEAESERFQFQVAMDGNEALEQIKSLDTLPDLILLDLNMPVMSGFEFLNHIKSSQRYRHIPVIVLSTSSDNEDVNRSYKFGANTFVVKPSDSRGLLELANLVRLYWFSLARIPTVRISEK